MSIRGISRASLLFVCSLWVLNMSGQIEDVKFGQEILDTALRIEPAKRINTDGLEFSPSYYRKGIVYVSVGASSKQALRTGEAFIGLEYAPLNDLGMPIAPVPFAIDDRLKNHRGPVAFSRDENTMYLSRSNMEVDREDEDEERQSMKIYSLQRGDTFWVDQQELPFNAEEATSFHPTISDDGDFMIFSSDREGGYGDYDLYGVYKIDGKWSEAFNLGPSINSKRDEAFPLLYKGKYLIFSSNRRGGEGKFDFYWSKLEDADWKQAVNLGKAFNSPDSEVGIAIAEDGKSGFFASDRKGKGDDIYAFFSSVHLFEKEIPLDPRSILVKVKNEINDMRLSKAHVWMFPVDEQGLIIDRTAYKSKIVEDIASQGLSLELERRHPSELGQPDYVTDRNGLTQVVLSPKTTYRLIAYKPGFEELDTLISYNSADSSLSISLQEIHCLPLEIQAFEKGGKQLDSLEIIVKNLRTDRKTNYDLSQTAQICISHNRPYEVIGQKNGYLRDTFFIPAQASMVDKVEVRLNLMKKDLGDVTVLEIDEVDEKEAEVKEGATIVLNNIYYDYNKSSIRVGAEEELDALAGILKVYPDMRIELSAHTDSRGDEYYNLRLSLRRAESAKEYLLNKGINEDRIQAIGYGESRIRNRCVDGVDCSEREHQYNRRTEVKITQMEGDVEIRFQDDLPEN